jgi:spermidine synthase
MTAVFEELDRRSTPMGEISLRRRLEPTLQIDVYEVKLDDEFLMSSLFTVAETELANLALAQVPAANLDVLVGGLGLGYTARAVLAAPRVRSLHVLEALAEVIGWHERHVVPLGAALTTDPRCHLVQGDFFATVAGGANFAPSGPDRYHAILVDIDHTPRHLLHPSHAAFYEPDGLRRLARYLDPDGVFALWSDGAPDDDFVTVLGQIFGSGAAHTVAFPNFYTGGESASTVYVAKRGWPPQGRQA